MAREGGTRRRLEAVLLGGALAVGLALGQSTPAAASPAADVFKVAQDPGAIRDYWTPERMKEAIPAGPLGEMADAVGGNGRAEAKRGGTIAQPVRRPGKKPKRSHGKVFLTLGGVDYVCSGTALKAPAKNVVWTAGHCVYDKTALDLQDGRYASNWIFVPAYRNGKTKLGKWVATRLAATPQWRNCGLGSCNNFDHDLGAANVVGPGGKTLQRKVGGRGIQFDGSRDRTYKAFGYPAEGAFNGERPYRCRSPFMGNDSGNPKPMRIRCDMTAGSSGGGWVVRGKVASVISYGYPGDPNSLYGPYQGASAQSLYDQVKNG